MTFFLKLIFTFENRFNFLKVPSAWHFRCNNYDGSFAFGQSTFPQEKHTLAFRWWLLDQFDQFDPTATSFFFLFKMVQNALFHLFVFCETIIVFVTLLLLPPPSSSLHISSLLQSSSSLSFSSHRLATVSLIPSFFLLRPSATMNIRRRMFYCLHDTPLRNQSPSSPSFLLKNNTHLSKF